jgi:hypothetical protein
LFSALIAPAIEPLLAMHRGFGFGWGWWWWWWLIVIFIWLIFIPPFGYGRRWYRTRSGGYAALSPEAEQNLLDWQAIEARFVDSPAGALAEADRLVSSLMRQRKAPGMDAEFQSAHAVTLRSEQGGTTTDEMRQAMVAYRALYERLANA